MITVLPHYNVPLCIKDEVDNLIGHSSYSYDQYDFEFCELQTYHTVEKWNKYMCDCKTPADYQTTPLPITLPLSLSLICRSLMDLIAVCSFPPPYNKHSLLE